MGVDKDMSTRTERLRQTGLAWVAATGALDQAYDRRGVPPPELARLLDELEKAGHEHLLATQDWLSGEHRSLPE
jgi:hypothetical protein